MIKEFKEFAVRGNVMDLAIGVIIGAAFGKIVTSITNDMIMPVLSLVTGKLDFSNMFVTLSGPKMATLSEAKEVGALTLNYGAFISSVVDFIFIAFVVFLLVRWMNRFRKAPVENHKTCPQCKMSINKDATRCPHCTSQV